MDSQGWIVTAIDGIQTIEYIGLPEGKIFGHEKTINQLREIITQCVHERAQIENLRKAYREDHGLLHEIKELLREVY